MSLFNHCQILVVLAVGLITGACGFEPVHKTGKAAAELKNKIEITAGKGREAFELRERLVERFGFSNNPRYQLEVTYNIESSGLAISRTAEVTRFILVGTSDFKIKDMSNGNIVYQSNVQASTGYNATGSTFATQAAEQDAQIRLVTSLADMITTRVTSSAAQWVQ